jgi:hypothetical protein
MAEIIHYNGTSSFSSGLTSFGYYDNDTNFMLDADRVIKWCARQMGFPVVDVELTNEQMYDAFESATTIYAREIYNYKLRDNYLSYEGSKIPNDSNFNIANVKLTPSLGTVIRLAQNYGSEALAGGSTSIYSGSLTLTAYEQHYDLNAWAIASGSIQPSDKIEIKRIYFENRPALSRLVGNTIGDVNNSLNIFDDFGTGEYGVGVNASVGGNYLLMPTDYDLLRIQSVEFNDQIRRSAYTFKLVNNYLTIFPIPRRIGQLWFEYIKVSERDASFDPKYLISGSTITTDSYTKTITNVSNVPFGNITYSSINQNGKDWIMKMTLVDCMRKLAMVRVKYTDTPLANGEKLTLNGNDLYTQSEKLETDLLTQLRDMLDSTSRQKQLEKQVSEQASIQSTLNGIPLQIYLF